MGKFTHLIKSQVDILKLIRILAYICAGFCFGYAICYLLNMDKSISIKAGIVLAGMPYAWTIVPIIPLGTLTTIIKLVISIALGWIITPIALLLRTLKVISNVFKGISIVMPDKQSRNRNQNAYNNGYPGNYNNQPYVPMQYGNQQPNNQAYARQQQPQYAPRQQAYGSPSYAQGYPNQGYNQPNNNQAYYNNNNNAYNNQRYNTQVINPQYQNVQSNYNPDNTAYINPVYNNYSQNNGYYSDNTGYIPAQRQDPNVVSYQDSYRRY